MLTTRGTLRIEDHELEGEHTWLLTGALTRATAGAFELTVGLLCAQGARGLALDVRALTLLDASGTRAIARARELCAQHGSELTLISLSTRDPHTGPRASAGRLATAPRELASTVPRR